MRLKHFFVWTIVLSATLVGCKKDNEPVNFHYELYPTNQGHYVTYSVREINIDDALGLNETLNYYIKAKIGDTIMDNQGRIARRYERYFRDSLNHPWALEDIWTTLIDGSRAELVEENQRIIKLVFKPDKYKEWNCNAYNSFDALDCYYREIFEPASINGFQFASTVTVEQEDFLSLVDYRRKYEQYAEGVGMYYKHFKDFRILNADTLNVVKGKELIMRLIDYGTE